MTLNETMLACIRSEIEYPASPFNGPDWQSACWEFVQAYPDMPEDEVMSLFHDVCEQYDINF